jgi:hypothetical protein
VKKKPSGALVLKIFGMNFPNSGTVVMTASGSNVTLFYSDLETSDFISFKISAASAPPPGTIMHVRVVTSQGIQSNEVTATAK